MSAGVRVQNPFPGLRPFEARDSTLFFGRDEQIGEALDRLLRQRLLALVGVSGCGKSSLVGAGMVPALEMGLAGDPNQRWRVAAMRPGDGPLRELGKCLGFGAGSLAERSYGLAEAVETHLPDGENLLLVVDQFEEIFPLRDRKLREGSGSEADLFVSYLLRAAQDPATRVYVLLTMRSDYLGECAKFHELPEALNDGQYLVPRMTRQQLMEAIDGPLTAASVEIHPAVVQDLLNRCDEEPDNLPLLQHLLWRMFEQWENAGGQGPITAAIVKSVGGLAEALDLDAETVYTGLEPTEQGICEVLFRRITESRQADRDNDDRPIRRPQTAADLARLARVSEPDLRNVVRHFEARGLLVVRSTDRGDKVDLPHECLCLKWRRLKEWIRAEAEDAKKLRFLLDAVGKSYLTGLALSEALEWQRDGRLNAEWCARYLSGDQISAVAAWVGESRRRMEEAAEADRRRQEERRLQAEERSRRARITAAILGVAFLIAVAAGVYAYRQKGEARKQADLAISMAGEAAKQRTKAEALADSEGKQRTLAEQQKAIADGARVDAQMQAARVVQATAAILKRGTRPDLAALLSLEGSRSSDSFEARNSLYLALPADSDTASLLYRSKLGMLSVAFSPDGRMLASAGYDKSVRLWDVTTGQPSGARLEGHSGAVEIVAFSPDGKLLASASDDKTVRLWDVAGRKQVGSLTGHSGAVENVAFSPDGKLIATASDDETVGVWDVATRRLRGSLKGRSGPMLSVAFSPDGKLLAGSGDGIWVWDVASQQQVRDLLPDSHDRVWSVAFSPDGRSLASGGSDGTVRLFELLDSSGPAAVLSGHSGAAVCVKFSRNGKILASSSLDGSVRLWDVARHMPLGLPLTGHSSQVSSVAFSPDGSMLATSGADGTVRLWDVRSHLALGVESSGYRNLAFSRDGRTLAASYTGGAQFWDVARREQSGDLLDPSGRNVRVAFSPDGKMLATGDSAGEVRLWDAVSHKPLGARFTRIRKEASSRGGAMLILAGVITRTPDELVNSLVFSPDSRFLATAHYGGSILLWDVARGRQLGDPLTGHKGSVRSVAFSPDGSILASAGDDKTVRLWDVARHLSAGNPLTGNEGSVRGVAFSPDGKMLASAGEDGTVRLWDLARRKMLGDPIVGHVGRVESVAFSPDGRMLASAGEDHTVRLWDTARRDALGDPMKGDTDAVVSVAFSPDGKWLASAGSEVRLWNVDERSLKERLCRLANRNLSKDEWLEYVGHDTPYQRTCPLLPPGEGAPGSGAAPAEIHRAN